MFRILFLTLFLSINAQAHITLYTDRSMDLMGEVADTFTEQTGIEVDIIQREWKDINNLLNIEGSNSSADVIVVKDLVYFHDLVSANRLQPLNSPVATAAVDPSMVTEYWTALTYRARTLVYHSSVDVSGINSYADLADPRYQGMLCLRTSKSSYNEALFAGLIAAHGYDTTFGILDGWLNNMVDYTRVYPNDRSIIDSIANLASTTGPNCQLGIVNSYYLGQVLAESPNTPVRLKALSLNGNGVHTNGIGAGISSSSREPAQARQFIEFMLTPAMQQLMSRTQFDFPANREVDFPNTVQIWSGLPLSTQNWSDVGEFIDEAKLLFEDLDYQ